MTKNTVAEIGTNSKGVWVSIQEAPWYAPVILALITGCVIAYKAFLNYLNKKQELQVKEKEHILAYKVKIAATKTRNSERG